MEFVQILSLIMAPVCFLLCVCGAVLYRCFVRPLIVRRVLERNGLRGPSPSFPLGNISTMRKLARSTVVHGSPMSLITHDIHPLLFPHFAEWRKAFGKVFVYWIGTEPFLYVAEPELIKQMISAGDHRSMSWGKPSVFRTDRQSLFGNGLLMLDGDNWSHRRHTLSPAFFPSNLKKLAGVIIDSASDMLQNWEDQTKDAATAEIDVEKDLVRATANVIAKITFGQSYQQVKEVFEEMSSVQSVLFRNQRLVGVPFGNLFNPKQSTRIQRLGKDIDRRILSVIETPRAGGHSLYDDLLGLLQQDQKRAAGDSRHGKELSEQDLVDECKTFIFGGHETTALALTWTLFLLALHPEWQQSLREEVMEVTGGQPIDANVIPHLQKMTWVMNEVLRLYSPAPNAQRQARKEMQVGELVIPKGTNIWFDIVGLNHDPCLWGEDVNEFRPERFKDGPSSACKHRLGFVPFGLGARTCVGQNLFKMEYKIVLSMILSSFSWSLSHNYSHSPAIVLTLRPSSGVPLVLRPLSRPGRSAP
ncbi:cytochrome P450 714C2 [Nymphaea colorata]|nr:cytochrome P450 714C2 [Nymphaea colorata]